MWFRHADKAAHPAQGLTRKQKPLRLPDEPSIQRAPVDITPMPFAQENLFYPGIA
jgi:hypothetical protein